MTTIAIIGQGFVHGYGVHSSTIWEILYHVGSCQWTTEHKTRGPSVTGVGHIYRAYLVGYRATTGVNWNGFLVHGTRLDFYNQTHVGSSSFLV